ncbi:hypothetical protein ABN584_05760 [Gloeocapsa sp. BRSZ]
MNLFTYRKESFAFKTSLVGEQGEVMRSRQNQPQPIYAIKANPKDYLRIV